jgi:hypothetical protein
MKQEFGVARRRKNLLPAGDEFRAKLNAGI